MEMPIRMEIIFLLPDVARNRFSAKAHNPAEQRGNGWVVIKPRKTKSRYLCTCAITKAMSFPDFIMIMNFLKIIVS